MSTFKLIGPALFITLVAMVVWSFFTGSQQISLAEINLKDSLSNLIFYQVRLPRTLAAVLAGAVLALGGLQLQTLFRNPLASPSILGLHSGASLAVALASLSGIAVALPLTVRLSTAFLGSLLFALILLTLARRQYPGSVILLTGVMISYLSSAIVSVLIYRGNPDKIKQFLMWGMGGFDGVELYQTLPLFLFSLASILIFIGFAKGLDALLLGNDYASTLGIQPKTVRFWVLVSVCLGVAGVLAFCGPIGFVGLIAPPLARKVSSGRLHLALFIPVILIGATLTLFADLCVRWFGPLPINALLGLIGAPIILGQLLNTRSSEND